MVAKLKPYSPSESDLVPAWQVVDAADQALGRLATRVAWLLMGKHRPTYVTYLPAGDFVVVTNASKIKVTGKKAADKVYVRHNQMPGHRKEVPYSSLISAQPRKVVLHAVKGMLPKNKLGDRLLTRLKVYAGPEHPHVAQVVGAQRMIEKRKTDKESAARGEVAVVPPARAAAGSTPAGKQPAGSAAAKPARRPAAPTVKPARASTKAASNPAASADAENRPARRPRAPGAKPEKKE